MDKERMITFEEEMRKIKNPPKEVVVQRGLIEKIGERIEELHKIKKDVLNSKVHSVDEILRFLNDINSRLEELKSLLQQLKEND